MKQINVFVPVYNEEKKLRENILKLRKELLKLKRPFHIMIVNDSSTDKTMQIAQKMTAQFKEIKLKNYSNGPSRRENLSKAILESQKDSIICFTDLDLSADITKFKILIEKIDRGADAATGSRWLGIKPQRTQDRLLISYIYNKAMQMIFKSEIRDHQCGFKAFKGKSLQKLIKLAGYDKTFSRGWFWDAEMLILAQKQGMKIAEFPIRWNAGQQSSFHMGRELRMIRYIAKNRKRIMKTKR
jgi:hypothetical protein